MDRFDRKSLKNVLYISTRFPFPISSGREKMIVQSLKFLANDFNVYFLYFSKDKRSIDTSLLQKYNIKQAIRLEFPNSFEIFYNILVRYKYSLQENLFFSEKIQRQIYRFIDNIKPDLVICDMIRTAQFVENLNVKKIVDMDDLLSKRYLRYLSVENKENRLLGTFENILPSFISNISDRFLRKLILKFESEKIKDREIELTNKFDAVFLVSLEEVKELNKLTLRNNIYTNPPAVEIHKNIYNPYLKENNFLFIGNMKTSQNLSSVKYIVDKILPQLKGKINFKFKIAGVYDERLNKIISPFKEQIELMGFVENLEYAIRESKLLLSPIAFGTGIKTKILDAMSYGLPVVTNSIGAEGLPIENGKHCIIENNPQKMSENILFLVKNPNILETLSKNAHLYVIKNHNFDTLKENFLSVVDKVLNCKS